MKFTESEKKLIELALNKAEQDGDLTLKSIRLDGILTKGGGRAYLTLEPAPRVEKPSSSAGCAAVAIGGFFIFVVVMGVIGSQHTQTAPQDNQAIVEATPTPEVETTPTPG